MFFRPAVFLLVLFFSVRKTSAIKQHHPIKQDVHFLVSLQTEGAAVGQLHDVDGEAMVSGLVTETELHLRAAERQPLLVGVQEEVSREARPAETQ